MLQKHKQSQKHNKQKHKQNRQQAQVLGMGNKRPELANKEQAVEEERESDTQFETTSTILERILEESELTNELLGGKGKKGALAGDGDKGGFSILEVLGLKKLADFVKAGSDKTYHKFKIFNQSCRYIWFSSNSRYRSW